MSTSRHLATTAIVLFFVSCDKDSDNSQPSLNGKWELVSVNSAWGRFTYPRGNGNTFVFKDSTYTQNISYQDTTYQRSGTFAIYSAKPCEWSTEQPLLQFDDDIQWPYIFSLSRTTFTYSPAPDCVFDGGTFTYRRSLFW